MTRRFVLAPEAARDLAQIWQFVKEQSSVDMADRVEASIRDKIVFLAANPRSGHWRKDLTSEPVKFFSVYSYLIVHRPGTRPLQVAAILHGRRDLKQLLKQRL
jgi:plasmid stabilization system protein ParE